MVLKSYTVEVLYGFPVHPVHLKARLMGQIAGLHYRSRSVDVRQTQNMTNLMNCDLIHGELKLISFNGIYYFHYIVSVLRLTSLQAAISLELF